MCQSHYRTFFKSTNNHLHIDQKKFIPCHVSPWYPLDRASLIGVKFNFCYLYESLLIKRCNCTLFSLVTLPVLGGMFTFFHISEKSSLFCLLIPTLDKMTVSHTENRTLLWLLQHSFFGLIFLPLY